MHRISQSLPLLLLPLALRARAGVGLLGLLVATSSFTGCSCESEGIDASLSARLEDAGADPRDVPFEGQVFRSNIVSEFDAVRAAVRGEAAGGRLVFTLVTSGAAAPADLALTLPTPLRRDDVLPVTGAFQGGGWGILQDGGPDGAAVSWRRDGAYAISADGEVRVLESDPLVLEVELALLMGDGTATTLLGEIHFRVFSESISCF